MKPNVTRKFSKHLRLALRQANFIAEMYGHPQVLPPHVVLGFCRTDGALAAELLSSTKLNATLLEEHIKTMAIDPTEEASVISEATAQHLVSATALAYRSSHPYVGTEHVLAAVLDNPGTELSLFLKRSAWSTVSVREQLEMIFKSGAKLPELTETFVSEEFDDAEIDELPATTKSFGVHLTAPDKAASLDPVIGRDREIERLMQILMRRTKNNPVLLGDPGVGKTAIVEGLAKRLAEGSVPAALRRKKLVSLDVGSLVAGTMFRGEFENRIKALVEELRTNPDVIVFIDELHTIVGAGAATGSTDAANLLKPALARGELRCIGATTVEEYRRSIENDGALERRFQPIMVSEPTPSETRNILDGLKVNYERYHGLTISAEALDAAVSLSERYLPERFFPDKAIDLIDEASARVKVQTTPPENVVRLQELEEAERTARRRKETATTREHFEEAIQWKEEAERLHARRHDLEEEILLHPQQFPVVSRSTVIDVLTSWTNAPVADLDTSERQNLHALDERLAEQVVGQEHVRKIVSETIRKARLGLSDRHRPLASFLFAGPSGVGKTTLAKAIAVSLFGDEHALLTIDMSEYSEGFTVSKLIGAPAGYVGYKESGLLTERVRRRPYQVLLFDELDRAHHDVRQLLQQILAEGSLRDATGRLVSFKQTILVATTNPLKQGGSSLGFSGGGEDSITKTVQQERRSLSLSRLNELLPQELLQRFDAILTFDDLAAEDLRKLIRLAVQQTNDRLKEKGFSVVVTETAENALLKEQAGRRQESEGGARAIKRRLQEIIETNLAGLLLREPKQKRRRFRLEHSAKGWNLV